MPIHPNIIISDESAAIKASIKTLKEDNIFHGIHLLDLYHILKNTKKKLIEKSNLKLFSKLSQINN